MLGYNNKSDFKNIHPADLSPLTQSDGRESLEKANEMISLAFLLGNHSFEWECQTKNEQLVPIQIVLTAIKFKGKDILHVVCHDIRDKKQTEIDLAASETKYQTLFNNSADCQLIIYNNELIECNNKSLELLGFKDKKDLLSLSIFNIFYSNTEYEVTSKKTILENLVSLQKRGSQKFTWYATAKDSEVLHVEVSCTLIPFNNKQVIHATIRPITSKEKFYEILEHLSRIDIHSKLQTFLHHRLSELCKFYKCGYAFIGLLSSDSQSISTDLILVNGKKADNFSYELKDTPCENVLSSAKELVTSDAQKHYPNDKLLIDMGINSYFGAPLLSKNNKKIGIIVIMDKETLIINNWSESVLGIYAQKIALKMELEAIIN